MAEMGRYCKAYHVRQLREFPGWQPNLRNLRPETAIVDGQDVQQTRTELTDDELMAKLRELQGTPDEVLRDPEIMALMLPIIRADFTLSETYRYREGPLLTCPVSAFGGAGDPRVDHDHLVAWREETRGTFRLRTFPGGHFFLHEFQADVLKAMTDDLAQVVPGL